MLPPPWPACCELFSGCFADTKFAIAGIAAGRIMSSCKMLYHAPSRERFRTIVAVNLATVFERTSEQVLPSVYAYVAQSFHSSPSHLGLLTLARSLAQAAASPVGGLAGKLSWTQPSLLNIKKGHTVTRYIFSDSKCLVRCIQDMPFIGVILSHLVAYYGAFVLHCLKNYLALQFIHKILQLF